MTIEEENTQLKSQLSTLQAQMKEVIEAGDEMAKYIQIEINEGGYYGASLSKLNAWKSATASLRQSGHKE